MSIKISMKKLTIIMSIAFFSVLAAPSHSFAMSTPLGDSTADVQIAAKIVARVTEIQNMDKTSLSASEKKVLKNELNAMKHRAEGLNSRVYLSVGAIIIIILLLILIL